MITGANPDALLTFVREVEKRGGTVPHGQEWLGTDRPITLVCEVGHRNAIQPNQFYKKKSLCSICTPSFHAKRLAEGRPVVNRTPRFETQRTKVELFDALVEGLAKRNCRLDASETSWKGLKHRYRIICLKGHETTVSFRGATEGSRTCATCQGNYWDTFYVVLNESSYVLKFGVSSHSNQERLATHKTAGFSKVLLSCEGLGFRGGRKLELRLMAFLAQQGATPVKGKEYFSWGHKDAILGFVSRALDLP